MSQPLKIKCKRHGRKNCFWHTCNGSDEDDFV